MAVALEAEIGSLMILVKSDYQELSPFVCYLNPTLRNKYQYPTGVFRVVSEKSIAFREIVNFSNTIFFRQHK